MAERQNLYSQKQSRTIQGAYCFDVNELNVKTGLQ